MIFLGLGGRTKIALFIVLRPGWPVTSPATRRRIVQARERADSLADASADQAEKPTPNDYSAGDWGSVLSALVRAEGRPDAKPDRSADQDVASAAMMRPRCLIPPRISMLRRKRTPRHRPVELSQRFAIVDISRGGDGWCVLTPRC
jgi:hypothetical protein